LQDDVLTFGQVGTDRETGDELGVHGPAGHGLEVGDVGAGLGEAGVAAQPVQLGVAPAFVFPVHGLLDQLRTTHGGGVRGGGEVLEVLGHPGQAHHLQPGQCLDVDHAQAP